jgi:ATP-dependent HslUV protease ATP-binding subunit HslU
MTIVEKVFEQINFDAPDLAARGEKAVRIDAEFVRRRLASIINDQDLSKFVL